MSEKAKEITYRYLKSTQFRVVYADGIHGGLSPGLMVNMTFFNERHPIPETTTHQLADGQVTEILSKRKTKKEIIREAEVNIMMNIRCARALHQWLGEKLKEHERILSEINAAVAQEDSAGQ